MWNPRSGEFRPPPPPHRRNSLEPQRFIQASQAHTRRQSTSSYRPHHNLNTSPVDQKHYNRQPPPLPRPTYRNLSLQGPSRHLYEPLPEHTQVPYFMAPEQQFLSHKYATLALPPLPPVPELRQTQPPNGRTKMLSNSFSLPWNLTSSYYNSKGHGGSLSKPSTPQMPRQHWSGLSRKDGRPSRNDVVKVSAPQDLDGDGSPDDRETQGARIVRKSFSSTSNRSLHSGPSADYREEVKKVYNKESTAYWAGRFMSIHDRLVADYPHEPAQLRVKRAFTNLQVMACTAVAEQSLMEFKSAFEKKVKKGADW